MAGRVLARAARIVPPVSRRIAIVEDDPAIRQQLVDLWIRLRIMRTTAIRTLSLDSAQLGREAMIGKLYWANLHQDMGEVAMDVLGAEAYLSENILRCYGHRLDFVYGYRFFKVNESLTINDQIVANDPNGPIVIGTTNGNEAKVCFAGDHVITC